MRTTIVKTGRKRKAGRRKPCGRLSQANEHDLRSHCYWETVLGDALGLYVMEAGPAVKIGVSTRPAGRLRSIQTGQAYPTKLVETFWMREADATAAESMLHESLRRRGMHAHGEWFFMSATDAVDFVDRELSRRSLTHWRESNFREAA